MAGDGREWVRWRKRAIDKKKHTKRIIIMKLNKRREKNGDKRYGDCKKHMIRYFNSHNNYNMCSEIPVLYIRYAPTHSSPLCVCQVSSCPNWLIYLVS